MKLSICFIKAFRKKEIIKENFTILTNFIDKLEKKEKKLERDINNERNFKRYNMLFELLSNIKETKRKSIKVLDRGYQKYKYIYE